MFLRFGKAGWNVVTKGRIFFRTSLFFCKADFLLVNLTSEVISQTTDSHFINYKLSFRFVLFRFVSLHLVSQTTVSCHFYDSSYSFKCLVS